MSIKQDVIADLHIHIGRTESGAPVKITAARSLTLERVIDFAANQKGLNLLGIIDCHVPEIIAELEEYIRNGEAFELEEGGIRFRELTLLPGTEMELNDVHCKGPIHVLAYFPTLAAIAEFSEWLAPRMKNRTLSSQRIYEQATTVQQKVKELGGLFIPAHIFTPFKSLFGRGVENSLEEVFDPKLIDAIEIGLSANTSMANQIAELSRYPFLTNSDAHSLEKIAREYQILRMKEANFTDFHLALQGKEGRGIAANYGLDPKLGKYYQTTCASCGAAMQEATCLSCGSTKSIKGVAARVRELSSSYQSPKRPPYIHQVPLEFIPKLGRKSLQALREHFGTDMVMLHEATEQELKQIVKPDIAADIIAARTGKLAIEAGGGGKYGFVRSKS